MSTTVDGVSTAPPPDAPVVYATIAKDEESAEVPLAEEVEKKNESTLDVIGNFKSCPSDTATFFTEGTKGFVQDIKDFAVDFYTEVVPGKPTEADQKYYYQLARSWIHIPYFPSLHRPGWLLRYILGPYNLEWVETILGDLGAGITVALTLVPQVKIFNLY